MTLFSWLFKQSPENYFRSLLILTRFFPSFIAGFITIYYINLNASLPQETFNQFRLFSVVIIVLSMIVTALYGISYLRDYPKLIRNLKNSKSNFSQTANRIVTFPMKQLIFEAWYGILSIPATVWLVSTLFLDFPAHAAFHLMVGGSMAVFITIFFNHLIFDRAIHEPLAFLFQHNIHVDFDKAKKFSLKTKLILSFFLVTLPTVLMVGALANQKALDILQSGIVSSEVIYSLRVQTILIAVAAFSIAILLAVVISNSISNPIQTIQNTVIKVEKGDLSQRVLAIQNNELGNLARNVNTMIERLQDLTANLEHKVQERTNQLIHAQKLASLGQLVAGIAHHINNKINPPIQGAVILEKALTKLKNNEATLQEVMPKMQVAIDAIRNELRVVKNIIDDLLISSRQGSLVLKVAPMDVNAALQSTVRMLRTLCLERIGFHESYDEKLPTIEGDFTRLQDVFMNLLKNAIAAIPNKGNIWIETTQVDSKVSVLIKDDGVGIPKENVSKIFDFFFTTKDVGSGTGLGLSVSYATVKEHGGDILVQSSVRNGSTFTVLLPIYLKDKETQS